LVEAGEVSMRWNSCVTSLALGVVAMGWISSAAVALPDCHNFFYNPDGSWSPTHNIVIASPTSQTLVGPNDRFRAGMPGLAGRIGASLTANCRYMATSAKTRIPLRP
jgi:hypothetical protein